MTTVFDMTLRVARKVTSVRNGVATGGATTSATVANNPETLTADAFINGTFWLISGTNVDKESRNITDNDATSFTFSAMSGAVASGDTYAYCDKDCPRDLLIDAVNEAVRRIDPKISEDTSTTVNSAVSLYTLPAGVSNVLKVEVARNASAPYYYAENNHWVEEGGQLRFDAGYEPTETSRIIRITYAGTHTELTGDSGTIPSECDEEAVFWKAVLYMLDPLLDIYPDKQRLQDVFQEAQIEWQRRMPKQIHRVPRFAKW